VARHVYEKAGFTYGGVRKNYYGDGEDAKVMWVSLKNV
ncbi:ribosomal-protein-alanine N-acetyltransferase, partial [Bacillus subtilis]